VSDSNPKVLVVIPAGGSGTRLGGERKQFRALGSDPVIVHTLRKFDLHPDVDHIAVATPSEDIENWMTAVQEYRLRKVRHVVAGGDSRQASVSNALEALRGDDDDVVLIHDAVRPFVSQKLVSSVIEATKTHGAAAPILESADTLRKRQGDFLGETIDRDDVVRMQTPQGFKYSLILEAHRKHKGQQMTDDVALVQSQHAKIKWVLGEMQNFKITTTEDWETAVHLMGRS